MKECLRIPGKNLTNVLYATPSGKCQLHFKYDDFTLDCVLAVEAFH